MEQRTPRRERRLEPQRLAPRQPLRLAQLSQQPRVDLSPGGYYAPYRGYSYRRVGIGFSLGALFYGERYWINDPWYYRLPPAYEPYRWVRYYDDVLLVNVYTGDVVDVIYDFFD
ncbi:RcnB family protein [Novosphingobium sp. 9]|uniref:RcnB family protein n=1 Tax=Novosphingobium sp. 9 TaxID=2025349 RepID=UPI0028CBAB40|nr:RcnB family protein [Novosphingobium sp. 9]